MQWRLGRSAPSRPQSREAFALFAVIAAAVDLEEGSTMMILSTPGDVPAAKFLCSLLLLP